ncbi:MAG TPA: diguanylate cyclase, partial [Spirochaetia bacterium]|nr:diguanylate cyclase [Spirochaetia bacterium]
QRLIDAYDTSGTPRGRDALHERFLSIFRRLLDLDEEILSIHHFISIFWSRLIADYIDPKEETRARELWNETIVLLDLLVQEVQSEKRARLKMESHIAVEVNENFISTFNLAQLKDVVLNNLARFQFDSYYVCLFTDRAMKKAKALLAYDKHRPGKISTRSFPAIDVLPSKIDTGRPAAYVVMALTYQDESYGYAVYSIQTLICFIYASLSVQISGAIKGARLTSELYDYATQLESKVRERTAELEDANQKLKNLDALKNDFIANITHDFRSPLTAILNVSNLALRYNTALDSETRENYDIIFKASLRLKSSIDKLLELARMDAHGITLKVREVEPVSFLDRLLDFYTSSVLGSGIRVVRKLPDACGRGFYTDPEKLEEIIDNIMSNAIKFVDPKNGLITVTLREEKSAVSISISDNGIGIASHKLEAIFNRFEQAHGGRDSPYTGTGIGLAFSRQLVEYLHGSIRAESAGEGRGATFIIELPKGRAVFDEKDFSDEEVKEVKREDLKTLIESDIKLRLQERKLVTIFEDRIVDNVTDRTKAVILIIDDDVNVREIVLKYLRNQRYKNFIIAPDGKMGLDAVYEYSPHLIICDYNMPNMRGDQFHDEIVENPKFKEIPFIFLSAIADDTIMLERRKRGASAYLKKPIDEKILLLTVEENINKYFDYLKISRLATVDELTGLNNRRAILDALRRELAIRKYRDLCLIFMDIDQFKKINDGFGHLAGDELLTAIGDAIQGSIRGYDQPGRYGGDEFLLILPETNLAQGMIVAEGLRRKTAAVTVTHRGKELRVTMSFGIASLREHSDRIAESLDIDRLEDIFDVRDVIKADWELIERQKAGIAEALLETADAALLQAKKSSCADCGFDSETPDAFTGRRCPQCGGGNITVGRNKVVAL